VDINDLNDEWQILRAAAEAETTEGSYAEAERLWLSALELAEEIGPRNYDQLYYTLESLAEVLWLNRRFELAAPVCRRLLSSYMERSSADHLDVGLMAQNLALIYHQWNKYYEAERFYKVAVQVVGLRLGTRHKRFVTLLESYTKLLAVTKREHDARLLQSYITQRVPGRWTRSGTWEAYNKSLAAYESTGRPSFERVAVWGESAKTIVK
jgi:tetratricopeptide (TPR) repeat protein